jgi:hypothetical protein
MAKRSQAPTTGTSATAAAAAAAVKRTRSSQPSSQRSLSPRQALAVASQAITFESELLEFQPEAEIVAPTKGSQAGTAATTEAGGGDGDVDDGDGDDFDGIDWERLRGFIKPLATQRRVKSWIFRHGYHVVEGKNPTRVWFVCKYCHTHKVIDAGGGGIFDVTKATTSAATHLSQQRRGHMLTKDGVKQHQQAGGQLSSRQAFEAGVEVSQHAANAMGNFNVQKF